MKMFWKMQDRAIDKLLGAQRARQSGPVRICREFDPELANAYIEHSLTTPETARYETHLSECAPCRNSVVALARMAEADAGISHSTVKSLSLAGSTQSGMKRLLGAMSAPQWAMAAAAVLVIAISLPVLISSRKPSRSAQNSSVSDSESSPSPEAAPRLAQDQQTAEAASNALPSVRAQSATQPGSAQPKEEKEQDRPDKGLLATAQQPAAPAATTEASAGVAAAPPPQPEPVQSKAETETADQAASKTTEQAKPAAPAPAEAQLPKIDAEKARSLPEDKSAAQVIPITPGRVDGDESRKQDGAIRDKDNIAPPRQSSGSDSRTNRGIATGPATRFRASRNEPMRGAAEKKVGGHKFWLKDDVWTDKDYNPDKEIPFVTLIRDSDVYHELMSKHSGMKPFLTGFTGTERVIFIYKGTAYMLIPQEGNK